MIELMFFNFDVSFSKEKFTFFSQQISIEMKKNFLSSFTSKKYSIFLLFCPSARTSDSLSVYVCPFVHPTHCPSVCMCVSICPSVSLSFCLIYMSVNKPFRPYMSACLSKYLCVCLSACLPVCLSACLLVCLSVCLFVCLSVCLFVCLSACPSVCLSVCDLQKCT
jgi:hypothetical protein